MGGALRNFSAFLIVLAIFGQAIGYTTAETSVNDNVRKPSWREPIIIAVSSSLYSQQPNIKFGSDVAGAIERSVQAWRSASGLDIEIQRSARQDVSPAGARGDGVSLLTVAPSSANTLLFSDSDSIPAKTRVYFSRRNAITEADIVLNPVAQFSTDGTFGTFDLETVLTHEIGHLIGLRHSFVPGSIMYDTVVRNGAIGREFLLPSVSRSDVAQLNAIYPTQNEECCASINGKVSVAVRKDMRFEIWAKDILTGEVAASTALSRGRSFKVDGLRAGSYEVFSQAYIGKQAYEMRSIGSVELKADDRVALSQDIPTGKPVSEIVALGTQGVLADRLLSLSAGTRTNILVAMDAGSIGDVAFEVDSPFIWIDPASLFEVDHADGVRTFLMSVEVDDAATKGNHTLCAINSEGKRTCLPGGLRVK